MVIQLSEWGSFISVSTVKDWDTKYKRVDTCAKSNKMNKQEETGAGLRKEKNVAAIEESGNEKNGRA